LQVLAAIKKKAERLRKNPPPLPRIIMDRLYRDHGIVGGKPEKLRCDELPTFFATFPLNWRIFRADESEKCFPTDDVYLQWLWCYPRYDFDRALHELRIHYHPSLLDRSEDLVHARVEINMKGSKQGRFLDEFTKMVPVAHPFGEFAAVKQVRNTGKFAKM